MNTTKEHLETLRIQAEEHEVIKADGFKTQEEYVLHLMHQSDYEVAASLACAKTVLDLGCNGGYGTNVLGAACKAVTGVDVSPAAINAAKDKYNSGNLSFLLVDGLTLPFASSSYDMVTSFQVIEHLADYDLYFSEIKRVLRPGGLLLLTTPNAAIRVHPGQKPWNPFHVHEFRASELADLVENHFEFAHVLGQWASETTHAVEYNRCVNARGKVHAPKSPIKQLLLKMPRPLIDVARGVRERLAPKNQTQPPEDFLNMHRVEDFC